MKKMSLWFILVLLTLVLSLRLAFPTAHLKLDCALRAAFDPDGTYHSTVSAMGDNLSLYGLHKTIIFAFRDTAGDETIPVTAADVAVIEGARIPIEFT